MINIKEKFLELTTRRYPKGTEDEVIKLIPEFKFEKDEFGNYYYIIKNFPSLLRFISNILKKSFGSLPHT